MIPPIFRNLFCSCMLALWPVMSLAGPAVRIKDLVEFGGVRGNDLVGYGLVVGLAGTGDGLRNSPFTEEALSNLLERLGINVTGEQFRPKNVAAVLVTADLPPFSRTGREIDVTVSAIGDASSLRGGDVDYDAAQCCRWANIRGRAGRSHSGRCHCAR